MTVTMNDERVRSIEELKQFVAGESGVKFAHRGRAETYRWIQGTLVKFRYLNRKKREKGIVKEYLRRMTGYSRAQLTRLIERYRRSGYVRETICRRHRFPRQYREEDISMLAVTDELHGHPNGAAVKSILGRMARTYGQTEYARIARISVAHLYNLRKSVWYRRTTKHYTRTRPVSRSIGERCKPNPGGVPGYLRVDTIHQGDRAGEKGVYHINTVDEVTQFEYLGAAEQINEQMLTPLLVTLLDSYPFPILGFHTDNGSEYINHVVVKLLHRLLIRLTKSRPRHANDNALVETKNGWVFRKWLGYQFVPQKYAARINAFYFGCFNEYLNFHRPCAYPIEQIDTKGRVRKLYPTHAYQTPYEKLKSIPKAATFLKRGFSFALLDSLARGKTDNQMAEIVQEQRTKLFDEITTPRSLRSGSLLD